MNLNLTQRLSILAILIVALFGGTGTASARAEIDITPIVGAYERCVEGSDPGLAYRCAQTMNLIMGDFAWPAGGSDPRVAPVYVYRGVFICASVPNVLVLGTVDSKGKSIQLELNSPSACAGGSEAGARGIPLGVDINPQYDPSLGPTMIAFDHGEDFRTGVCAHTVGNLAVFWRLQGTDTTLVFMYFAPTECSGTV